MKKQNIVVFGRGNYYKKKKESIYKKYRIVAFLDNSVKQGVKEFEDGVRVYNPEDRLAPKNECIVLMSVHWFSMYKQLMKIGIEDSRILFGVLEEPCFNHVEEVLSSSGIKIQLNNGIVELLDETNVKKYLCKNEEDYRRAVREIYRKKYPLISTIGDMSFLPISASYGTERGKSIDRVYIDRFLKQNSESIHGVCMEIGDDGYIKKYGQNVEKTIILHVEGEGKENVVKGNFETGEGIEDNSVDCLVCTQTLQSIYDIHASVKNIHRMLKKDGVALFTVSGAGGNPISYTDYHRWGVYWRFTDLSLRRLLEEVFDERKIETKAYGNMKTMMSIMYGMCAEDLSERDFDFYSEKYQMIVTAVARK